MGFYLFAGLVLSFIGLCIFLAFKWELESFRLKPGIFRSNKKHDKETTATAATGIATTPPGFEDNANPVLTPQNNIESAALSENHSEIQTMNTESDQGDSNNSDNGGYDSGGYDSSGGGYS